MNKSNKFSPEVRERAARLVQEHCGEYPSLRAAVKSIAPKIGCVPQTLLDWVKRQEIDHGVREVVTTTEAQRVKDLEREVCLTIIGCSHPIGYISSAEAETNYYRQLADQVAAAVA